MLGLRPGDAKILRNAGARVTDDVLRTLVLASYLLGVDRAMVIAHTDCRMATGSEDDVHTAVHEAGLKAAGFEEISVEFTHQVADGMHGAIVKAVKTTQPEAKGLPVIVAAAKAGCC